MEKALLRDPFSWVAGGQAESMAAQRAAMLHRVGYLLHREPTRAQLFAKHGFANRNKTAHRAALWSLNCAGADTEERFQPFRQFFCLIFAMYCNIMLVYYNTRRCNE